MELSVENLLKHANHALSKWDHCVWFSDIEGDKSIFQPPSYFPQQYIISKRKYCSIYVFI